MDSFKEFVAEAMDVSRPRFGEKPVWQMSEEEIKRKADEDYIQYWEERWAKSPLKYAHMLPSCVVGHKEDFELSRKFDWERFVEIKEVTWYMWKRYRIEETKTIPMYEAPEQLKVRILQSKKGTEFEQIMPFQTYMDGGQLPTDFFTEIWDLFGPNTPKRRFTYGHMEFALKSTRRIWQKRLQYKKAKDNWQYVITPLCLELLGNLHEMIHHWKEIKANIDECKKQVQRIRARPVMIAEEEVIEEARPFQYEIVNYSASTSSAVTSELIEQMSTATISDSEPSEVEDSDMEVDTEDEVHAIGDAQPQCSTFVEKLQHVMSCKPVIREPKKTGFPFRWYPKIKRTMYRHSPACHSPFLFVVEPIFTPEDLKRNYFTDLPRIFTEIGRPDLAQKCCIPIHEDDWLKTKRQYFNVTKTSLEPNGRVLEMQSGRGPTADYRPQAVRILMDVRNKFEKHQDKMLVLCHYGRFAYMTKWDLLLYATQRRILSNINDGEYDRLITRMQMASPADAKISDQALPWTYVEQAEFAVNAIHEALRSRCYSKLIWAFHVVRVVVRDWREHDFNPERVRPRRNLQIQSDDGKPGLGAAAPSSSGTSSAATAEEKTEKPIVKGDKKMTITMVDQREEEKAKTPGVKMATKVPTVAETIQHSVTSITSRPQFITKFVWSNADETGKRLQRFMIPQVYFSSAVKPTTVCQALAASYQLSMFGAAKFDVKVKFQINSTKFQQGRLIAFFIPFYMKDRTQFLLNNCTQYPHTFIDATSSNPVTLTIPFTNPRDALLMYADPHNEISYFGTLQIGVWNALETGATGSIDAMVSMWMWLENLECFQFCNPKDPVKIHFAEEIAAVTPTNSTVETWKLRVSETVYQFQKEVQPQSLVEGVASVAGMAVEAGSEIIKDVGANLLEGLLQKVARGSNSKPGILNPPLPVLPQVMSNSSHASTVDTSTSLTLHPLSVTPPDQHFERPANMRDLLKQWSRIGQFRWTTQDDSDKSLAKWPMMPQMPVLKSKMIKKDFWRQYIDWRVGKCSAVYEKVHDVKFVERYGSMLDYLSQVFQYWRGGIKYRLEVVCTSMHSGRLLIRYEPYGTTKTAVNECQKLATPGIVWDIQEQHTLDFTAPYMSVFPYLLCQFIGDGGMYIRNLGNVACGVIEIAVMNALKCTTGVSQGVTLNVYMAAADDFQFGVLSPLDGIVSLRSLELSDGIEITGESNEIVQNIVDDLWNFMNTPNTQKWPTTRSDKVTIAGGSLAFTYIGQAKHNQPSCWVEGPFSAFEGNGEHEYKSMDPWFFQWRKCLENMVTLRKKDQKEYDIPRFMNFLDAVHWLRQLPPIIPTGLQTLFKASPEVTLTPEMWDKLTYWMAVPAYGPQSIEVDMFPSAKQPVDLKTPTGQLNGYPISLFADFTFTPKTSAARNLEIQANDTAKGPAINPFDTFTPKVQTLDKLMGEDFTDIYAIMKRWNMWRSFSIPDQINYDDGMQVSELFKTEMMDLANAIPQMNQWERKNYVFELRIPVTPMHWFHVPGMAWHNLYNSTSSTTCRILKSLDCQDKLGCGYNVGKVANITTSRYFGELFTFWRGRLRWRFTFPDPNATSTTTKWWMLATYNSRVFTPMGTGPSYWRLTTTSRMRDASRQGTVLYSGNIMNNIDVETPYYSQCSRLYTSDRCYSQIATAGSLSLFFPISALGGETCYGADAQWDKLSIDGLDMWCWTAVGDDFEYHVPRAAPQYNIYMDYYFHYPTWNEAHRGYDNITSGTGDKEQHANASEFGAVTKEITPGQTTALSGIGIMYSNRAHFRNKEQLDHSKQDDHWWFSNNFNWRTGKQIEKPTATVKDEKEEKKETTECKKCWEIQGDDVTEQPGPSQPILEGAPTGGLQDAVHDEIDGMLGDVLGMTKTALENFNKTIEVLSQGAQDFTKLTSLAPQITTVLDNLGKASDVIQEKVPKAAESVEASCSTIAQIGEFSMNAARLMVIFHQVHQCLVADNWSDRWIPISVIALAIGLSPERVAMAGQWLLSCISDIVGSKKVPQDQKPKEKEKQGYEDVWDNSWSSFFDEHFDTFRMIAAAIVTITMFAVTTSTSITTRGVSDFSLSMVQKLRNFAFIGAGLKTLDWMFKWIADVVKTAVVTVGDWLSGGLVTAHQMQAHYPEVLAFLKKSETYDIENVRNALQWDNDALMELWKIMDEGEALVNKLTSKTGGLFNTLSRAMSKLSKINTEAIANQNFLPFRMDPFHICLYGTSGVKKSSILTHILNFICDEMKYPKTNRFYSRSEEDDYWSKYCGQTCTFIDDLYSDQEGTAIKELIKMKTNLAWAVPMADLSEKGRMFTSKIIGSTTNTLFPKPPKSTHPQAIWRRRNLLLQLRWVPCSNEKMKHHWNNMRFDLIRPDPPTERTEIIREGMTFMETLALCRNAYEDWAILQSSLVFQALSGTFVDIPNYGDPEWRSTEPAGTAVTTLKETIHGGRDVTMNLWNEILGKCGLDDTIDVLLDKGIEEKMLKHEWYKIWRARTTLLRECSQKFGEFCRQSGDMGQGMVDARINALLAEFQEHLKVDDEGYLRMVHNGVYVELPQEWRKDFNDDRTSFVWKRKIGKQVQADTEDEPVLPELSSISREQRGEMAAMDYINSASNKAEEYGKIMDRYRQLPKQKFSINMANPMEMEQFVSNNFPQYSGEQKKKMVMELTTGFNRAVGTKEQVLQLRTKNMQANENYKIFAKEIVSSDKYWKLETVNGKEKLSWIMMEPESHDDFFLFSAWMVISEDHKEEEIMKMYKTAKDDLNPEAYKYSQVITVMEGFMQKTKKRFTDWFDKHPIFKKVAKIALMVGGVLLGYKTLKYLIPSIIEKIEDTVWSIFGWTKEKIGSDRVDAWTEKLSTIGQATKAKTLDYYRKVREMLRLSPKSELRAIAEDPEEVMRYAESLDRMTGQIVATAGCIKAAEYLKHPNPYYLGQDRSSRSTPMYLSTSEGLQSLKKQLAEDLRTSPRKGPQGSNDKQMQDLLTHRIPRALVRVAWYSETHRSVLNGVMVRGTLLLVPKHFFENCEIGQEFTITTVTGLTVTDCYFPDNRVDAETQDFCLYKCRSTLGQFKDLIKHFVSVKNTPKITPAVLVLMNPLLHCVIQQTEAKLTTGLNYSSEGESYENILAWDYQASTQKGDCGSLLIAQNPAVEKKLLGIHVAGVPNECDGSACYVCQEELEKMAALLQDDVEFKVTNYLPEGLQSVEKALVVPQGNFEVHGAVVPSKAVRLPHKTEIIKSPIHDLVREHVTEPSVLVPDDPRLELRRSPLIAAINKYGNPVKPFPIHDLRYVEENIKADIMMWKRPMEVRLLTDWEAVFGNETIEYCDRMNLAASPGYPYTLNRPSREKGKAYLFDIGAEDGIADQNYRVRYQNRELLARAGMRMESLWTDCLKDERRPLKKIREGKTRAFMLPPADYVQLCRKYFMAFCVCFYSNNTRTWSAVGIDCYSFQWTQLVRRLKKNSNLAFGGDFHSYDGIIGPDFFEMFVRIVNAWYREYGVEWEYADDVVRSTLMWEAYNTVHICKNTIYEDFQGNPSGNPLTVILNTVAHYAYMQLAWLGLARVECPEMLSLYEFNRNVCGVFYGDDGVMTVKWEAAQWYNLKSVSEYLAKFGIEYTDEQKSEVLYTTRPLTKCTFLKNGFVKMKGTQLWLAPIAEDTIYELTNWMKTSDDPMAQFRENLENAMKFAFHHGRDWFERFKLSVDRALKEKKLAPLVVSYDHEYEKFMGKCRI